MADPLLAAISLLGYQLADLREAAEAADPSGPLDYQAERGDASTGLALVQAWLPTPVEGRLLSHVMQDHYLAVHTTAGSEPILSRMEDAHANSPLWAAACRGSGGWLRIPSTGSSATASA